MTSATAIPSSGHRYRLTFRHVAPQLGNQKSATSLTPEVEMSSPPADRALVNVAIGYLPIALNAFVTVILVPLYARSLGHAEWGTVAQCLAIQGLLFTMDVALGALAVRDIAARDSAAEVWSLYRRYVVRYFIIGLSAGTLVVTVSLSPFEPMRLTSSSAAFDTGAITPSLLLLALSQFLAQFVNAATSAYWAGQRAAWRASAAQSGFLILKHATVLATIFAWTPSAQMFLLIMAVASWLEVVANNAAVARHARQTVRQLNSATTAVSVPPNSPDHRAEQPSPSLQHYTPSVAPFVVATMAGTLGTQIDRVVLGMYLPSVDFGVYFLATLIALSILSLQAPIGRVALPLMASGAHVGHTVRRSLLATLFIVTIPACVAATLSTEVLWWWLRDRGLADSLSAPARWMLLGVAMITVYGPFANYLMAKQRYRHMLATSVIALFAQLVVVALVVSSHGNPDMQLGSLMWIISGCIHLLSTAALLATDPVLRNGIFSRD